MNSYPEFIEDVKFCFSKFINSYDFQLSYNSNAKATLSNSYYSIEFNMNRMELDVLIGIRGALFRLFDILNYVKPEIDWDTEFNKQSDLLKNDSVVISDTITFSSPFRRQLFTFSILIDEHLNKLFEGDNNWVVGLNKKYLYERKIRKFIGTFPPGHELYYIKNSGSVYWLKNALEYCNKNNIEYPRED